MSDRWQDDAEYQRRKTIDWADTGINIDYAAELGVEAYKRWLAAGGGSITPHPEARETDTGFSVTSEEYLAQIDAAVARGDAPAYMAEMLRHALAAGGSPTTTPTTEQVEAAAIVLFAQAYGPENSWVGKGVSASERDDFRDCARAALVAASLVTPEDQQVEEEQ